MTIVRVPGVIAATVCLAAVLTACTPVSEHYRIHSDELTCEEANRAVYDAVEDMGMTVTSFRLAKPGSPGVLHAVGRDGTRSMTGKVTIRCDPDGVHIRADSGGIGSGHDFERGVFLSVTGRTGLVVESGRLERRAKTGDAGLNNGQAPTSGSPATAARHRKRGVRVVLEPLRGFATVLDFEADLSAVGILPVKVTVVNDSSRSYELDPRDIALRASGSRQRVRPMSADDVVDRLVREARGRTPDRLAELGDVVTARRTIRDRRLKPATLRPGDVISGFLYFETGLYDRARVTLIDAATGETEGFLVEF